MLHSSYAKIGLVGAMLALAGCTTLSKEDAARLDKANANSEQALSAAQRAEAAATASQAQSAQAAQQSAAAAAAAKDAATAAQAAREAIDRMMQHSLRK